MKLDTSIYLVYISPVFITVTISLKCIILVFVFLSTFEQSIEVETGTLKETIKITAYFLKIKYACM